MGNKNEFNPEQYAFGNLEVLHRKRQDYGSKNITDAGLDGLVTRLRDKLARVEEYSKNGTANYEKLDEVFLDVANYGIIGQMLVGGDWDEQPKSKVVYLSGSIDNTLGADVVSWKKKLQQALPQHTYFDPAGAFVAPKGTAQASAISAINRMAIDTCDTMVANVGVGKCFGTIREIEYAVQQQKEVLVFGYPDLIYHVEAWDLAVFNTVEDIIGALS